jgi:polyhydroxyalkanoate synthase subunit PhaC
MSDSDAADAPLQRTLSDTALALANTLLTQPGHHAAQARQLLCGLGRAIAGGEHPAALLQDARFSHPGWRGPLRRRLLSAWNTCSRHSHAWADGLQLGTTDRARLDWLLRQLDEAASPANSPLCPRFAERLRESRGRSLQQGLRLLAQDLALKRALPAQSPDNALLVGRDMACTPGDVVRREALFELIQYRPTTARTAERPLLIIPPPLNRFYLLDMTPANSLVRHALDQGLQVFMLSWRNPNPSHCEWGLQAYVEAAATALDTSLKISGSDQATLLGVCAGGLIGLLLQGWLQARGQAGLVAAGSYLITPIDARLDNDPMFIASPEVRRALRNRVWRQGCLGPRQLAAGFAWLLPRQLIWTPLLKRYTLGEENPLHPARVWNQDSTRLPARLVDDLLRVFEEDWFAGDRPIDFFGTPLDLRQIITPSWHLGAATDHIVPWANSYPGERLGGDRTFVLSSGGHIQSLLNQPGLPRSWYQTAHVKTADPHQWAAEAPRQRGSWWPQWSGWIKDHSGRTVTAPASTGNADYPALYAAPGRYVHQS